SHSFNQKEKKFRIITSLVGQYIQNNFSQGISLMASKASGNNKTRTSLAVNWSRQEHGNSSLMLRLSNTLKIGEKQNLQASAGLQLSNRKSILNGRISYNIRL
ncbi:MAG: hypothetical protein OEY34_09350, partial [Cyclobacteriaceae bacterium]|nr:hypothetical protein [Cyclobacteriaceae bacterium]